MSESPIAAEAFGWCARRALFPGEQTKGDNGQRESGEAGARRAKKKPRCERRRGFSMVYCASLERLAVAVIDNRKLLCFFGCQRELHAVADLGDFATGNGEYLCVQSGLAAGCDVNLLDLAGII